MKKLMLGWMVVTLSVAQVEANTNTFFDSVKAKTTQALIFAKTKAAYVVSCIREPNAVKINKAVAAKEAMLQMCASLRLDADNESGLLQNVQALGFGKKNALLALTTIQKNCAAMQLVVNRYNGILTPWNKSASMEAAAQDMTLCLEKFKIYEYYFERHKDCLKGWELVQRYESAAAVDIVDAASAVLAISVWYKNNDAYNLIKSVDWLVRDIAYIKSFLTRSAYRQAYPELYGQLYNFLPILEFVADHVTLSSEYKSQWFYKTNKPTPPSKNVQKVSKEHSCVQETAIDHELMISRADQFGNNPY